MWTGGEQIHCLSNASFSLLTVQGCANPSIPENMEYTRQDDVIYYSCIHGDRAWTQRCYGNAWIGSMLSCDDISDSQGVWQILYSDWSTPYGKCQTKILWSYQIYYNFGGLRKPQRNPVFGQIIQAKCSIEFIFQAS